MHDMNTQTGGSVKQELIHFPGECPAGPMQDRIIQVVAIVFLTAVATLALMAVISGGAPWSPMGKAHQPPPLPAVTETDSTVCA